MSKKINILLISAFFLSFVFCGCTSAKIPYPGIKNPPVESFVKVFNTVEVFSCKNKKDKNCPIGSRISVGSGMAAAVVKDKMTVLTSGHVCDVMVTDAIDNYTQTLQVLDKNNVLHQAWPVVISHGNGLGSVDACVLWVPTLAVKKIPISKTGPTIGNELYYIGAPAGIYHPPTVLIFKGIYSGQVDASSSLVSFPAKGGASGSAVFDTNNKIVGLIWGVNSAFEHATMVTNYKAFLIFIKSAQEKLIE